MDVAKTKIQSLEAEKKNRWAEYYNRTGPTLKPPFEEMDGLEHVTDIQTSPGERSDYKQENGKPQNGRK